MIVVAAVTVVVAPIIAAVIPIVGAVILLVGARNPANIFLDLLVGFVSICPLFCHREKVLD
jgi:hypothetical protein